MKKCNFCNTKGLENRTLFKNGLLLVILSNTPIVRGHLLILPKRHVRFFGELTGKEQKAIFSTIAKMRVFLKKVCGSTGFNFAWNEGADAGQSINHLHIHMLPRKVGDLGIYKYEPRKFLYRPGPRVLAPKAEFDKLAKMFQLEAKKLFKK